MSALANKRALEQMAGLPIDSSGMSGADLEQALMVYQTNSPSLQAGMDGARADQMDWRGAKDDFTGPNGGLLSGRYTKNGGRVWVVDAAGFTINGSNQLAYDGVSAKYAVVDTGLMDNFAVRAKVVALSNNGPRFILRATGANVNNVYVQRDQTANTWALINNTGSVTISSFADATDIAVNDVIECQVRGDNVTVLVNGVVRGILTGMSGVYSTGSLQGLRCVTTQTFTLDDFYAYPLAN